MASLTTRRIIWTGTVASITIVGALSGAMLKSDRESVQEAETLREATLSERIAMLENKKERLLMQRSELQKKLSAAQPRDIST